MENKLRKLVCPQCKISNFYVKNENGERRLVFVMSDFSIRAAKEGEDLAGFDLSEVFCLGCSWHGSPRKLVKY